MDTSPTTIILVGVVCIVLGFFASVLLNTIRDEEQIAPEDPPAPPGGRKGKYAPVARLWREKKSGVLLIEMEGKTLLGPGPLSDAQRGELESAARDMRTWLGMGLSASSAYQPAQAAQAEVPAPTAAPNANPAQAPFAPVPAALPKIQPAAPTAVSAKPAARMAAADPVVPAIMEKSIVMQIEDILQDIIAGGPYANKGLHLLEDPVRGVIVTYGNERYEGIDSVPIPEVKAVLRSAVTAWENR